MALGSVLACTVGNFISATPMVNAVFGLFLIPLASAFAWPRANVSAALGIVAVVGVLSYPTVGRLADRYGVRRIVLSGNVAFALALAALSLANGSLPQFYLLYALVGATAAFSSTVLYSKVVSGWSSTRRGLLLGISAGVGVGSGATLMPIICGLWLAGHGWRASYQLLGLFTFVVGFPVLWLLLRDPPRASPASVAENTDERGGCTAAQARRSATFWMLLISIALGAGCMTAVFAHVVPMELDRGIALGRATSVLSVFALVGVGWQIAIGYLLDRVDTPKIALPFYLSAIIGMVLFQRAATFNSALIAAVFMGIGLGTEYGVLPYYLSRYFGLRSYGAIYGAMYGTITLTMGVTPFLMDKVFDATGSYDGAIYAIDVALALGALLIARLRPYPSAVPLLPVNESAA